jgi:two-component system OmpR family response regulator
VLEECSVEANIQILVVDDEPDIRRIIRILLENGGYAVLEAPNGRAAVETVKSCPSVDLILMDIMMPDMSGIEASRAIRTFTPAPILFLTARTQEQDKQEAYSSGGDDYLAKPFSHAELLMKVDSLLRRYRVYKGKTDGTLLRSDIVLDEQAHRVLRAGEPMELTETEFEILQFLAANRGKVVSVEKIYEGVWHEKYMPSSTNTVMVHIVNLRKKLEEDPANPRLIRTVWGKGYQID